MARAIKKTRSSTPKKTKAVRKSSKSKPIAKKVAKKNVAKKTVAKPTASKRTFFNPTKDRALKEKKDFLKKYD